MEISSDKLKLSPALHLAEGSAPSTEAGEGALYVDSADHNLKFRAQGNGSISDLLAGGGALPASYGYMAVPGDNLYSAGNVDPETWRGFLNFTTSSVVGAPYVTFVNDNTNGDYLLIGSSGAGLYVMTFNGFAYPAGPVQNWTFGISVNGTVQQPQTCRFGTGNLELQAVALKLVLPLVAADQVRLEMYNRNASTPYLMQLGGAVTIHRVGA